MTTPGDDGESASELSILRDVLRMLPNGVTVQDEHGRVLLANDAATAQLQIGADGMTTTAEGVETPQQKELLRALGCTQMQGFLFSAARPSAEVRKLFVPPSDDVAAVA